VTLERDRFPPLTFHSQNVLFLARWTVPFLGYIRVLRFHIPVRDGSGWANLVPGVLGMGVYCLSSPRCSCHSVSLSPLSPSSRCLLYVQQPRRLLYAQYPFHLRTLLISCSRIACFGRPGVRCRICHLCQRSNPGIKISSCSAR
jgi:hypothetical protein